MTQEWPEFDFGSDNRPSIETGEVVYEEVTESSEACELPSMESLFTVIVDTREQLNYTFENIIGDTRGGFNPIIVKRVRKKLPVGDYGILGYPEIAIERKSKSDLFSSLANSDKRNNFLNRLRAMSTRLRYGAVVIECNASDLYDDPPVHTQTSPASVYRTILSWQQKFPLVHWHFCSDRDFAEQTTFRLLEKFWEDETDARHQTGNSLIDNHVQAFRDGVIARKSFEEHPVPYSPGNQIRSSWLRGWAFYSIHFAGGELGTVYEIDNPPPLFTETKPKKTRKKKIDSDPMAELNKEASRGFKF